MKAPIDPKGLIAPHTFKSKRRVPLCKVCGDPIWDCKATRGPQVPSRCYLHRTPRCKTCGRALWKDNKTGYCMKHMRGES